MGSFKFLSLRFFLLSFLLSVQILCSNGYYLPDAAHVEDLFNGESFDFIIAGGGTAGCTVAARLAETGRYTVLLIEAGGLPHPDLDIPALSPKHQNDDNIRKLYPTVLQRQAALAKNGVLNYIRGNMLGGSSGINGMILNRGSPHDYDNWARLTGDESWNYANMLKYFKKFENYTGEFPSDQRGFHGPLTISRPRWIPGTTQWLQSGPELGYRVAEPNSPEIVSFTPLDFTMKRGKRVSSYKGYIESLLQLHPPVGGPPPQTLRKGNLLILINTEVKRIIFEGNRAVGVTFTSSPNNMTHIPGFAKANKEVILSCGAIDTPTLLLRSGIGPQSELEQAHIPPVKFLPVGHNLHDHPLASLVVAFSNRTAAFDEDVDLNPAAWKLYQETGEGPYASFMAEGNQAILTTTALPPEEISMGWGDLQLLPLFSNVRSGNWERDQVKDVRPGEIIMPWSVFVARPRSRGALTLNPRNVDDLPQIDFQYLTNPYDVQVMIYGLKVFVHICEDTQAFRRVGCRITRDPMPACDHLPYRSDPFWECYGIQVTRFGYHAVGSCRMGKGADDPEAVVDSQLRVIGIDRLRVVDASVMPAVTNANTQAPVYAIAEKAADMILHMYCGGPWEGVLVKVMKSN